MWCGRLAMEDTRKPSISISGTAVIRSAISASSRRPRCRDPGFLRDLAGRRYFRNSHQRSRLIRSRRSSSAADRRDRRRADQAPTIPRRRKSKALPTAAALSPPARSPDLHRRDQLREWAFGHDVGLRGVVQHLAPQHVPAIEKPLPSQWPHHSNANRAGMRRRGRWLPDVQPAGFRGPIAAIRVPTMSAGAAAFAQQLQTVDCRNRD